MQKRKAMRILSAVLAAAMSITGAPQVNLIRDGISYAAQREQNTESEAAESLDEMGQSLSETGSVSQDTDEDSEETRERSDEVTEKFYAGNISRKEVSKMDFSAKRLIVRAQESAILDKENILSSYGDVFLLQYGSAAQAQNAYSYYLNKSEFVSPDMAVVAAGKAYASARAADVETESDALSELKEARKSRTKTSAGVTIAVIDSGMEKGGSVIDAVSMIGEDTGDDNGHGTQTLQYIIDENPEARIISIKALDRYAVGTMSAVYAGIEYAVRQKADILLLPLYASDTEENAAVTAAVEDAVSRGITVVGAAGNDGADAKNYIPGGIEKALIAGACNGDGKRRKSSNYGDTVDYYIPSGSTSEAAAKIAGFLSGYTSNERKAVLEAKAAKGEGIFTAKCAGEADSEEIRDEDEDFHAAAGVKVTSSSYTRKIYKNHTGGTFTIQYDGHSYNGVCGHDLIRSIPSDGDSLKLDYSAAVTSASKDKEDTRWLYMYAKVIYNMYYDKDQAARIFKALGGRKTSSHGAKSSRKYWTGLAISYMDGHVYNKKKAISNMVYGSEPYDIPENLGKKVYQWVRDKGEEMPEGVTIYIIWSYPGGKKNQPIVGFRKKTTGGSVMLIKRSADPYVTDGNEFYSLAGTSYGLFSSRSDAAPGSGVSPVYTIKLEDNDSESDPIMVNAGTYYYRELKAGPGYELSSDIGSVRVRAESDEPAQILAANPPKTGSIKLHKTSELPAVSSGNSNYSLSGAVYTLYQCAEDGSTGEAVKDSKGDVRTAATDKNGNASFEQVPFGRYYVRETIASPGFSLDDEAHPVTLQDTANQGTISSASVTSAERPNMGTISIQKAVEPNERNYAGSNPNYSDLSGAEFSLVYQAEDGSKQRVTNAYAKQPDGSFTQKELQFHYDADTHCYTTDYLPFGSYAVTEEKPPAKGFVNYDKLHKTKQMEVTLKTAEGAKTSLNERTVNYQALKIRKIDAENTQTKPQGSATLKNVQFTVKYYTKVTDKLDEVKNAAPAAQWVLKTDKDGWALMDDEHKVSGSDFYKDVNGNIVLPVGCVTVEESKEPEGYLDNSGIRILKLQDPGNNETYHTLEVMKYGDLVIRGDLELVKAESGSWKRMAFVPFRITSCTTGESHIIVTDQNGQAATSSSWNRHSSNTNAADDYEYGKTDAFTLKEYAQAGVWFYGSGAGAKAKLSDNRGALPYDTYKVEELPCESNKDHDMVAFTETVYDNNTVVHAGTLTDSRIAIQTKALGKKSLSKYVYTGDETVFLQDTVSYTGLSAGHVYRLKGTLMDKETGKALRDTDASAVTVEKEFKPQGRDGSEKVTFEVDSRLVRGKTLVVFERLYDGGKLVTSHEEIGDENQTLYCPEIHTEAADDATGTGISCAAEKVSITDTVICRGFPEGVKCTMTGTLVDKETGLALKDAQGRVIEVKQDFISSGKEESIKIHFRDLDTTKMAGKSIVVFEKAESAGDLIASHEDLTDLGQTIRFPDIHTNAVDEVTGSHIGRAAAKAVVTDTVSYTGLIPGKKYRMEGTLMDCDTGDALRDASGKEIQSAEEFRPKEPSGEITLNFRLDASLLAGKSVVVFEKESLDGKTIAVHADIHDEDQTVHYPALQTLAEDASDGDHQLVPGKSVAVTDKVSFRNLVTGQNYKVSGILMNKKTGKAVKIAGKNVTASTEFNPQKADGIVDVTFHFRTDSLEGKELVVFETLSDEKGSIIAEHADIEDKDQTVSVEKKTVTKKTGRHTSHSASFRKRSSGASVSTASPETGDLTDMKQIYLALLLMSLSALALAVVVWKQRSHRKREGNGSIWISGKNVNHKK